MGDRDDGKPGLAQMAMDAVTERQGEVLPGAVRQDVPRLARREARLVHQPATLVGTSDSGVDASEPKSTRNDELSAASSAKSIVADTDVESQ